MAINRAGDKTRCAALDLAPAASCVALALLLQLCAPGSQQPTAHQAAPVGWFLLAGVVLLAADSKLLCIIARQLYVHIQMRGRPQSQ